MSAYFGKHGKPEERKYTPHGRTKQSQKKECDINLLLERNARSGALSHLDKYQPMYGDYSDYDFEHHINMITGGQTIFEHLPAEVKREFHQSAQKFFEYVTDPENQERLPELLPQIANRGNYFPSVTQRTEPEPEPNKTPAPISAEMKTQDGGPGSTTIRAPEVQTGAQKEPPEG